MFSDYFTLGIEHILDPNGYDHILFVTVLCALYNPSQWKKILILVTAFTVGHSLTLALAALDLVSINAGLIEKLIPITIILTGLFNIYSVLKNIVNDKYVMWNYMLALGFGLIHGLGFSNYFKAILGREESLVKPLFAFNIGVEAGQIAIVAVVMTLGYILLNLLKLPKKYWTIPISVVGILVAVWLLTDR
jgi:hypothetical protein